MSRTISFTVAGKPIPQGSKGVTVRGGKAQMFDTNASELRKWRRAVALEAMKHRVTWIRQSPLCVRLVFQLPPPKRPHNGWAPVTPDIDKCVRAILDALVDGKLLIDDAQVVELHTRKIYGEPGVAITVSDVGPLAKTTEEEAAA